MGPAGSNAHARALEIETTLSLFHLPQIREPTIVRPPGRIWFVNYRASFPGTGAAIELEEHVRDGGTGDPRVKFAYHLWDRGTDRCLWRWERDPDQHPEMPDHEHRGGMSEARYPVSVSCLQAVRLACRIVYSTSAPC